MVCVISVVRGNINMWTYEVFQGDYLVEKCKNAEEYVPTVAVRKLGVN